LVKVNQRKQREFHQFEEKEEIDQLLKDKFKNKKLFIRYSVEKTEAVINEFFDDGTMMIVTDPNYKADDVISMYSLSDKYIEVDFTVIEERGPGYYHCRLKAARRAASGRRDLRFKVTPEDAVATNFRISKHTIDVSGFNMPTSIKVVLDQFHTSNSSLSDIVKVDVLKIDNKDPVLKAIKKTGKSVFIPNADEEESYGAMTDDFVDMRQLYGNEFKAFVKKNIERGYKSIIYVPIIYITEREDSAPFAYIHLISKSENLGIEKVLELKDHSFKLVDRIRDANTLLIPVHQNIMDISRGGAKLKITDENLKKSMLKSKGFIFDIVFKLQAPITIYGEIKVTYKDDREGFFVGIDFEGNSSRKDEMKRFYNILEPMEKDYKARLIRQLRGD